MIYLVSYDITNNRLRKKIADKLLEYGLSRLQYSVFAGPLTTSLLAKLQLFLKQRLVDSGTPTDKILIIPITQQNLQTMIQLGESKLDLLYLSGLQNTLYIG